MSTREMKWKEMKSDRRDRSSNFLTLDQSSSSHWIDEIGWFDGEDDVDNGDDDDETRAQNIALDSRFE